MKERVTLLLLLFVYFAPLPIAKAEGQSPPANVCPLLPVNTPGNYPGTTYSNGTCFGISVVTCGYLPDCIQSGLTLPIDQTAYALYYNCCNAGTSCAPLPSDVSFPDGTTRPLTDPQTLPALASFIQNIICPAPPPAQTAAQANQNQSNFLNTNPNVLKTPQDLLNNLRK